MKMLWELLTKCLLGSHDWIETEGDTFTDGRYLSRWVGRSCKRCIIAGSVWLERHKK